MGLATHLTSLLFLVLLSQSNGQRSFVAPFIMTDSTGSSLTNYGGVRGIMSYNVSAFRLHLNFTGYPYSELYEFNSRCGLTGANPFSSQFLHRIGASCSSAGCETVALRRTCPVLWLNTSSAQYTSTSATSLINGRICNRYVNATVNSFVSNIYFSGDQLCQFTLTDGRTFTFPTSPVLSTPTFPSAPTNCKCGQMVDVVVIVDGSVSISAANWDTVNTFVANFASSFVYSQTQAAFGLVQFSSFAREELAMTTVWDTISNKVQTVKMTQLKEQTCITCGLAKAVDLIDTFNRPAASKVFVLMTDGTHNIVLNTQAGSGCSGSDFDCDINYTLNYIQRKYPDSVSLVIGVGTSTDYNITQLRTLAGDPLRVFTLGTFNALVTNVNNFAQQTCGVTGTATKCGQCCGFCTCGTCQSAEVCSDFNLCTKDGRPDLGGCCADASPECLDPDVCSTASCDQFTGNCSSTPVTCDSNSPCYSGTCYADNDRGCEFAFVCQVPNRCFYPGCGDGRGNDVCTQTAITCPPSNGCENYTCAPASGNCLKAVPNCNDNNRCTIDSCNPSAPYPGCSNIPVNCNSTNKCFKDYRCDNATGSCVSTPVDCNDQNVCTEDSCNPSTGCVNTIIPCSPVGINPCLVTDGQCNNVTGCKYVPKTCDDGNNNTIDFCNPVSENGTCINNLIPCIDDCTYLNNECFKFYCNLTDGAGASSQNCDTVVPLQCDDKSVCTEDSCSNSSGCVFNNIAATLCPPRNCKRVSCDPAAGCIYTDILCQDEDPCTEDSCNNATGQCEFVRTCADLSTPCLDRWCEFGQCKERTNCKLSPDPCFVVTGCDNVTGCILKPKCNASTPCTTTQCVNGDCIVTRTACDDGSVCTNDFCNVNGTCTFTPIPCDDNNKCTIDSCNRTSGCSFVPIDILRVCNDNDACTIDSCNSSVGCVHTPITCNDGDNCTVDSCDKNYGCLTNEIVCPAPADPVCEVSFCSLKIGQCTVTRVGCVPRSITITVVGAGISILIVILIAVCLAICCAAHGGAYYHGLHGYYIMGTGRVKVQTPTYAAGEPTAGKTDSAYKPPKVYEEPKPVVAAVAAAEASKSKKSSSSSSSSNSEELSSKEGSDDNDTDESSS